MNTEPDTATQEKSPAVLTAAAWNKAHQPGTPVLYRHNGAGDGMVDETVSTAFVRDDGQATVRLGSTWQWVPLVHVEAHPLAAQVAALTDAAPECLDFPPPACDVCRTVDCHHDGDGFRCPGCGARWSSNGMDGVRPCVECDNDADVLGEDGQPRCRVCQIRVLTGEMEATEPYNCRRCKQKVTGIGVGKPAHAHGLCGGCHHADVRQAEWDRYLAGVR